MFYSKLPYEIADKKQTNVRTSIAFYNQLSYDNANTRLLYEADYVKHFDSRNKWKDDADG